MTGPRNGGADGTDGDGLQVAAHLATSRHQPLLAAGSTSGLVQLYDLRQSTSSHLVASLKLHQKPLVRTPPRFNAAFCSVFFLKVTLSVGSTAALRRGKVPVDCLHGTICREPGNLDAKYDEQFIAGRHRVGHDISPKALKCGAIKLHSENTI